MDDDIASVTTDAFTSVPCRAGERHEVHHPVRWSGYVPRSMGDQHTTARDGPTLLTTPEVRDLLAREGLPSSEDSLSRCVAALFDRRELMTVGRRHARRYDPYQVALIVAAVQLLDIRSVKLRDLRGLRRFARRQNPEDEAGVLRALASALGVDDPIVTSSEGRPAA